MPGAPDIVTRFAPSPTGALHLGNARTALFNALVARAAGGRFILRVEDTDAQRSEAAHERALLEDLRWLGLEWDEGPDVGGAHGPYRQSERTAQHTAAMHRLREAGLAYPCFCSAETLQLQRKLQLSAGRPPRYAGTCARVPAEEAQRRIAAGEPAALRFRVPAGRVLEYLDLVHGPQRVASEDIGDFLVGRADGSAAFFLSNALDDSAMGVTLVLRGDDHLANTPRQLLLLEALGLPAPRYGHLPLVLAPGGAPLSKRAGADSLRQLRAAGYLPGALRNYLARLGHSGLDEGWYSYAELAGRFRLERIGHSAAHFDADQLRHWQRLAVTHAGEDELFDWLGVRLEPVPVASRPEFLRAVRGNLLFPDDVDALVRMVVEPDPPASDEARLAIATAGSEFFDAALRAWQSTESFRDWTRALAAASGRRGAELYRPLRAALTGELHGPELAPLVALMGRPLVQGRLERAAALAGRGTRERASSG
jgi:glutamyl-tRNA synthetase